MDQAVRRWAGANASRHPGIVRVGYFGSYARGDWGVGSDLDLLLIIDDAAPPPAAGWDTGSIPVPVDLLVYTRSAWDRLDRTGRFYSTVMRETVWVYSPDRFAADGRGIPGAPQGERGAEA